MRIKIIGDNNCARATRHLLRLAGFAVTEFLPADVITAAPHCGYAITIESVAESASQARASASRKETQSSTGLAPAPLPLTPAFEPDSSTYGQPARLREGALRSDRSASSPASLSEIVDAEKVLGLDERPQADGSPEITTRACATGHIHFDSVDGALEAAVLRHVSRMAKVPVMVDRPGGIVHSERELRIVVPCTADAKVDESAAVAVEFGVLRGLLDLTRRPAQSELSAAAEKDAGSAADPAEGDLGDSVEMAKSDRGQRGASKWWIFGLAFLFLLAVMFGALVNAAPRVRGAGGGLSAQADGSPELTTRARATDGGTFRLRSVVHPAGLLAAAAGAAPAAQGQFATGQAVKIFDGTNTLIVDPCKGQTKSFVSINQTANAQLAAGTASKKIYICSIHVVVAAATSVALVEGTGTACATGTAGVSGFGGATAATGWNFMANGGIVLGSGDAAVGAEGTAADNLCLFNSGSGQVSGGISYVVQ